MCAPRKSLMVELKGCHLHKGPLCKVRTISPYCYYGHPSSFEVVTKRLGTLSFGLTFLSRFKSKQKIRYHRYRVRGYNYICYVENNPGRNGKIHILERIAKIQDTAVLSLRKSTYIEIYCMVVLKIYIYILYYNIVR